MIKVEIIWTKNKMGFSHDYQTKTFDTEDKAVEWCRRNEKNILQINNSRYFLEDTISHFEIISALRGR